MMIKTRFIFAFTLVASIIAVAGTAIAQMPATLVETDTLVTLDFHEQITLVGRTEARIESRIVAEVSGRVAAINAGEGNWIERNGTLITIDPEQTRLSLEAKKAEVTEARVQMELAMSAKSRADQLFEQNLVREITRDSAHAWFAVAEARHQKLGAERDQLALDLQNCRVKAPFSGYTLRRSVDVGEWVNPGTPVFGMVELSELTVVVDLPERHFGRVAMDMPASIVASTAGGTHLSGRITGFAPSAVKETHTYPVIITADNTKGHLGAGALVRATLNLDKQFQSLAVSKDAIVRQGPQTMIYTIRDGQAAPIPVVVTSNRADMVAIAGEGLAEGLTVVVRGNERIFPGSPVRTADAAPGPPEEAASP